QPQHLKVGDDEPRTLDGRHHLGEGWDIAAREDVLGDEWVGGGGWLGAADGMDQGDAIVGEQIAYPAAVGAVVVHADMFEHAHRHDALEATYGLAVGPEFEAHGAAQPLLCGTLAGNLELFVAQRNSFHVAMGHLGEIECKAAPARPDVEDALPRLYGELGGQMALLV